MSYYPESDKHIRNKIKVIGLSNYVTKKELEHARVLKYLS